MRIRVPDALFVGGSRKADFIGQAAGGETELGPPIEGPATPHTDKLSYEQERLNGGRGPATYLNLERTHFLVSLYLICFTRQNYGLFMGEI